MRNLIALHVLFCSYLAVSGGDISVNSAIGECCAEMTKMKLPVKKIVSYKITSSTCPTKAVIFQMSSGKNICVDPSSNWVSRRMKAVDLQQQTTTKRATSNPTSTSSQTSTSNSVLMAKLTSTSNRT